MAENETTKRHILLSDDEMGIIVADAVERGIHEGFLRVGIDVKDPIQLQRDFLFVRDLRKAADGIRSKALYSTVGIIVAGVVAVVWLGLRTLIHRP